MQMRKLFRNVSAVALTLISFTAIPALADDTTPAAGSAHSSGPVDGCVKGSENEGFWKRLSQSYEKHLFPGDAPAAPAVNPNAPFDAEAAGYRQDLPPPPLTTPPWPYSTWNDGGTQAIGYENMDYSALMESIYCGPSGKAWKDSRFVIHGRAEPGGNVSPSNPGFNKV